MTEFLMWYYSLTMEGTFIFTSIAVFSIGAIVGLIISLIENKMNK